MNIYRRLFLILLVLSVSISAAGCDGNDGNDVWPMSHTSDQITITLTNEFFVLDPDSSTARFASRSVTVTAQKTPFSSIGTSVLTPASYALEMMSLHGIASEVHETDDYARFSFNEAVDGDEYYYEAYCYKTESAYWVVQFSCPISVRSAYDTQFDVWASTVIFDE